MLFRPGFEPTASRSADRRLSMIELTGRRQTDKLTKDVSTLEPCAHFSAGVHCLDLVIGHWHRVRSLSRVLKNGCVYIKIKCSWAPCPVLSPKCSYFMNLFSDLPDKLLNYRILFLKKLVLSTESISQFFYGGKLTLSNQILCFTCRD